MRSAQNIKDEIAGVAEVSIIPNGSNGHDLKVQTYLTLQQAVEQQVADRIRTSLENSMPEYVCYPVMNTPRF